MDAQAVDHRLVMVDEFDALCIDIESPALGELGRSLGDGQRGVAANSDVRPAYTKYPARLHAKKVLAEMKVEEGLIYLPGLPEQLYEDSDMGPAFRQRRYFFYLSGANFPGCSLTLDIATGKLTLWIPIVEPSRVLWYGRLPGIDACLKKYDVDEVRDVKGLQRFLLGSVTGPSAQTLYLLHKDQLPKGFDGLVAERTITVDWGKLAVAMDNARMVKTAYEVAMIRKANDVSSAAHRAVAERLKGFTNEREVEALFQYTCNVMGTKMQAYPIIAGSGINAATLHYDANNSELGPNQLLVLDAGCEWNCYASDITRTLPIHGFFTPEAAAIYNLVQDMQDAAVALLKPGVDWWSLETAAVEVGIRGLLKLGILQGDFDQVKSTGIIRAFFPHGLGHHVGLEVHDVQGTGLTAEELALFPPRSWRMGKRTIIPVRVRAEMARGRKGRMGTYGLDSQLSPEAEATLIAMPKSMVSNMIVTVEPGIYFCREWIENVFLYEGSELLPLVNVDVLDKYYPVGGVRIEDDYLVTDSGCENLSTAPKGVELLRIINGEH